MRTPDTHLVFRESGPESGHVFLNDEGGDTPYTGGTVSRSKDGIHIGDAAVGDEGFLSVEDIFIALPFSEAGDCASVRTGLRFGQGEGCEFFTGAQYRQKLLFLFLTSTDVDSHRPDGNMAPDHHCCGQAGSGNFFQDDTITDFPHLTAAVFFGEGYSEKTQFSGFID